MKAIFSIAVTLLVCGFATASANAQDKADPVGNWQCSYKIGDQQRTSTLSIKKEGDKLKGKGTSDYGNEKREFEIEGKREK